MDVTGSRREPQHNLKAKMIIRFVFGAFFLLSISTANCLQYRNTTIKVTLECTSAIMNTVRPEFLSVALDCSLIREKWKRFNFSSPRMQTLAKALSPAVLRLGGTDCDFLVFQPDFYSRKNLTNFTMTGDDWISFNKFSQRMGFKLLFDVNVLLRNSKKAWDYSNAKELLDFNSKLGFPVDFELGNEPNLFNHVSPLSIPPEMLGRDYKTFRTLLKSYPLYSNSKVVGPATTRPPVDELGINPVQYLNSFLQEAADTVDAVTWHQYYLNGRIATAENFTSVKVLDLLPKQIIFVQEVVNRQKPGAEIWLGETSSAFGGGAKGLSDKYIAGFLWLDKLGVAAQQGLDLVIRQSLYGGNYALIDSNINPKPDYWLSLIYKRLVGQQMLVLSQTSTSQNIRFYAHCMPSHLGGVVLYGLNLDKNSPASITLTGLISGNDVYEYLLEPTDGSLTSDHVSLNGNMLVMKDDHTLPDIIGRPVSGAITLPPSTFAFYTVPDARLRTCGPT